VRKYSASCKRIGLRRPQLFVCDKSISDAGLGKDVLRTFRIYFQFFTQMPHIHTPTDIQYDPLPSPPTMCQDTSMG